mgnify:FL=1
MTSPSGSPVYRHTPGQHGFRAPAEPSARRDALDAHVARFLGEDYTVWHEVISDLVHLDVYMWRPNEARPLFTFMTVGMSDLPMSTPHELSKQGLTPYAELMLSLPADWPVPTGSDAVIPWDDENAYFPVRALKSLGRLPHEYGTWLGFGHTVPNGDPPEPVCDGTDLVSWLVLPPMTLSPEFRTVSSPDGMVDIMALVAITADELDLKLRAGVDALFDGFDAFGVSEILDVRRASSLRRP